MDGNRFDELTRGLANLKSRRGVLKTMSAAALGAVGLSRSGLVEATTDKVRICHKPGTPAEQTMDVPNSAVAGHLGHGDYLGPCCKDKTCPPDQCNTATCNNVTGACGLKPKANGTTCSDGNACTQTDTCQNGSCVGSNPVVCAAPEQCHTAGSCDPATGQCSNPNAPDETPCDAGNACTSGDFCSDGKCLPGPAISCDDENECTTDTCSPDSGCQSTPNPGAVCNNGAGTCDEDGVCRPNNVCAGQSDSCNGPDSPCGSGNCFCTSNTEGGSFCGLFTGGDCSTYQTCATSINCPLGLLCAPGPDCCGGICVPPCPGTARRGASSEVNTTPGIPPF